eukprot:4994373-Prymnesium_polylepis.1
MAIARNVRKSPTRVCGGVPLGAPSALLRCCGCQQRPRGRCEGARAKSKLGKIEAATIEATVQRPVDTITAPR